MIDLQCDQEKFKCRGRDIRMLRGKLVTYYIFRLIKENKLQKQIGMNHFANHIFCNSNVSDVETEQDKLYITN